MLKIVGIALIGVLSVALLKKSEPAVGLLLSVAATVLLFFAVADETRELRAFLSDLMQNAGVGSEYVAIPLKALGLTLITQLAADTAKQAGENTLATQIEFAGRALILYTALPILKAVLQVVTQLVNNQ